jgi:hypothetical protein
MRLALADDTLTGCSASGEALRTRAPGVASALLVPGVTLCLTRTTMANGLPQPTVQASMRLQPAAPALDYLPRTLAETTVLSY